MPFQGRLTDSQLTYGNPLGRGQFLASENQAWSLTVTDIGVVKHDRTTGETFYALRLGRPADLRIAEGQLQARSAGEVAWRTSLKGFTAVELGDNGEIYAIDPTGNNKGRQQLNFPLGPVLTPLPDGGWRNWIRTKVRTGMGGHLSTILLIFGGLAAVASLFFALRPRTDEGYAPIWPPWPSGQGSWAIAAIVCGILALLVLGLVAYAARPEDQNAFPNLVKASLWVVLPIVGYVIATALILFSHVPDEVDRQPADRAQLFAVVSVVFAVVVTGLLLKQRSRQTPADVSLAQVMSTKTSAASTVLLLWTFVVVYGIALIAGWHLVNGNPDFVCRAAQSKVEGPPVVEAVPGVVSYCFQEDSWYQYLLLLGVPGAAAALSKQKLPESDGASLDTSAENTNAVAEVQYFIFNAIAMVFVLASLVTGDGKLPEIPSVLLALTGASALVYTVEKRVPAKAAG